MDEEITNYLFVSLFKDKSQALCIIWIGANDYLNGNSDVDGATTEVVNEISYITTRLIKNGVKNILILNLPDLSKAPYAKSVDYSSNLHALSVVHNLKLANLVDHLKSEYTDVKIVSYDIMGLLDDIVSNPEKYNQKYNKHIKNTGEACWQGGYTLKAEKYRDEQALGMELEQAFKNHPNMTTNNVNVQALTHHLLSSPDLAEAYAVGKLAEDGGKPCDNPDDYAFWYHVHPSEPAHQIMAAVIIETLHNEGIVG